MLIAMDDVGAGVLAKMCFGAFLILGVPDMPPVPEGSGLARAVEKKDLRNVANYIPHGYAMRELAAFTNKINTVIWKKARKPQDAQDAIASTMEKLFAGSKGILKVDPSQGRAKCESWVLTVMKRVLLDLARGGQFDDPDTDSLTDDSEEGEGNQRDVADTMQMGRMLDRKRIEEALEDPDVLEDLKKVHPDAPLFVSLMLDGYDQKEILGNPPKGVPSMLPHWTAVPGAWASTADRNKTTKILAILRAFMNAEASPKKPAAPPAGVGPVRRRPGKNPNEEPIPDWDDAGLEPYGQGV